MRRMMTTLLQYFVEANHTVFDQVKKINQMYIVSIIAIVLSSINKSNITYNNILLKLKYNIDIFFNNNIPLQKIKSSSTICDIVKLNVIASTR